jgi:predicted esterase
MRCLPATALLLPLVPLALALVRCGSTDEAPAPAAPGPAADAAADAPAEASDAGTVESVFVVPASLADLAGTAWFDHPWPSDMRRDADGSIHLAGYYNPRSKPLLAQYVDSMAGVLRGFSPVAAGYLRFTGAVDATTLPADPAKSVEATSSVQLLDVDAASPEKGQRRPLTLYWRKDEGAYWVSNTLAFMPTMGFPLRPATRYALVVTDALKAADGGPVRASASLRKVLGLDAADAATQPLRDAWAPAVQAVAAAGIDPKNVVHLSVFTTGDPTAETVAVADDARKVQPAPVLDPSAWKSTATGQDYDTYEGSYGPSPDYQAGKPPFEGASDGGGFAFDAGKPVKQREFWARFLLTVPKQAACAMPAAGYPIVMYAHGTGGSYKSFISDGTALALAKQCLAAMGVDQIMHGPRLPAAPPGKTYSPELLFFNFQNAIAARTNPRQSGVDEVVRARLARETGIAVPLSVSKTGAEIKIDPARVIFFGHSQGGLNGPIFLAIDDGARGGVLSGSASMMSITLLEKTKPTPSVAGLVKTTLLGLSTDEYEELNSLHPAISLMQSIVDAADPIHYVPMIVRSPRPGFAPKSIYQTEGVNADFTGDSYAPPHGIEVQAVATGLPPQSPIIHPIAELAYSTLTEVTVPAGGLSGNLAGGKASGVLAQWAAAQASDGHYVVFDIPAARQQAAVFCRNLADNPIGKVPPP